MRRIAIYARKSVFREDSISIETQIEHCRYFAKGEECAIYQDNGFSGKDTNRPDFKRLMRDIKSGRVSKVIVYKLDRVSRSILDFEQMMAVFKKYDVDFVSSTESFDTSTPMGKAMMSICVIFAQLEREQIQQRIADAYKSRSDKGFYMGGKIPYGYKKVPVVIDGVNTSMYEQEPNEAEDIRLIYHQYSKPNTTLGDVLRELTQRGININRRGKFWNTARLSEVMRNPAYVRADYDVYSFFKDQGSVISNPIDDFDGEHACYFYSYENKNRKTWDLKGTKLVLAPHIGIVSSDVWLTCRKKLLSNHQIKTCKPKNSFLSGKVKCGSCGYAMVIRKSKTKAGRYFICQGKTEHHCCKAEHKTIYASELEQMIVDKMTEKINSLIIKPLDDKYKDEQALQIQKMKDKICDIEHNINSLLDKIVEADDTTMKYINNRIAELDKQKTNLQTEIDKAENIHTDKHKKIEQLTNVMGLWDKLTFDDKVGVVNLLIKKIEVHPENTVITWFF